MNYKQSIIPIIVFIIAYFILHNFKSGVSDRRLITQEEAKFGTYIAVIEDGKVDTERINLHLSSFQMKDDWITIRGKAENFKEGKPLIAGMFVAKFDFDGEIKLTNIKTLGNTRQNGAVIVSFVPEDVNVFGVEYVGYKTTVFLLDEFMEDSYK